MSEPNRFLLVRSKRASNRTRSSCCRKARNSSPRASTPKTKRPYFWPRPLPKFDDLPCFSPEQVADLLSDLRSILPNVGASHTASSPADRANTDQARLAGDLDLVRKAVRATPNTARFFNGYEDYRDFGIALKASLPDDPDEAFDLWSEWCLNSDWSDNGLVQKHWDSFKPPFAIGADYIFRKAQQASDGAFNAIVEKFFEQPPESIFGDEPATEALAAVLRTFTGAELFGRPIPEQEWLVKDFIPAKNVTLLGGDGGTGKSLLSLQLAEAVATGGQWLGMEVAAGKVLFLSAEDEEDELHRRASRIQPDLERLDGLVFAPLAGEDAVLMAPGKDGLLEKTSVWKAMLETVRRVRPVLLVLDTLADLFGGDEIKKIHARQFVAALRGLALEEGLTVLLLYHPSQSGMSSGSGTSGNTAWNNSVRSRLYFTADATDPDVRQIEVMKANRSARGDKISLRYLSGKFVREGAVQAPRSKTETEEAAERVFLKLLDQFFREGRNASHAGTANNFAPKVFADHPMAEGLAKGHLAKAMNRLFASGRIKIEEYGKPSNRRERLVRTNCPAPCEAESSAEDKMSSVPHENPPSDAGPMQAPDLFQGLF